MVELLAPAGNWECARSAVANGADAIYFGLDQFNARMRADNFTLNDLPALMDFLHQRGVKGYVTLNTLIFTAELPAVEDYLRSVIRAGVDAAIVQDIGLCRLIRLLSADFPIHASTQMTITSGRGVEFAQKLGCDLVVLARECSIPEIGKIRQATSLPLEVFVHGALCVAYSGQCLTSEALGGRSANRGECAQACRMPYDLIVDGEVVNLTDRKYLLSPQDLAGLSVLEELIASGVCSLKIEGRLKTPEYVAAVTQTYRQAIDRILAEGSYTPTDRDWYKLQMSFSRGFYSGWLEGINNQKLVHAHYAKKRGVYLGTVERVQQGKVWLKLQSSLQAGDGVLITRADREMGGRVYGITTAGGETGITFGHHDLHLKHIKPGDRV
ncbi:MAG: U32 family peptidase, partial [Cyanobacteria bacterium KgW148]|nr:U32 family peptidase [Cyanobacteria bacterium KgW148]